MILCRLFVKGASDEVAKRLLHSGIPGYIVHSTLSPTMVLEQSRLWG
jgi:hypothetical protein